MKRKYYAFFSFGRLRRSSDIIYTAKDPITILKLRQMAKTCLDFSEGIENEDISFSITTSKKDEDNVILHDNNIKNKFDESNGSIKITISTKQLAFSKWSFNMMTKAFDILATTFSELPNFNCDEFREIEKTVGNIADKISEQIKECYEGFGKTAGMKEAQRWSFIERILLLSVVKSNYKDKIMLRLLLLIPLLYSRINKKRKREQVNTEYLYGSHNC